jgi:hypothetical protein
MVKTLYFLAIMLAAIAMGAALAHLFELPNKIDIGAADYLTVQRNYDNWWIVGLSVPLAFLGVVALTIALRGTGTPFTLALIAFFLLVGELFACPLCALASCGLIVRKPQILQGALSGVRVILLSHPLYRRWSENRINVRAQMPPERRLAF